MLFAKFNSRHSAEDAAFIKKLAAVLGFKPGKAEVYLMAFRHKSAAVVLANGFRSSNERLEFLGDAVLGTVVADLIFKRYPYRDEGFMTEMRSKIVSRDNLNALAMKLGFEELIRFDIPDRNKRSLAMFGDALEALVGAIYIDKGFYFTKRFILKRIVDEHMDLNALEQAEHNHKSKILEWCQQHGKRLRYDSVASDEPGEGKLFMTSLFIDDKHICSAKDYNKKNAEKTAAEYACKLLDV